MFCAFAAIIIISGFKGLLQKLLIWIYSFVLPHKGLKLLGNYFIIVVFIYGKHMKEKML